MRKSGILMHITSLPGPYGIGSMGQAAYDFVDFLQKAGQSYWQILPLCPTGYGDSPYQSFSTFAGNHYLIDLDDLVRQNLLTRQELEEIPWFEREDQVDFGGLYVYRNEVLHRAFRRFQPDEEFRRFVKNNDDWLEDYALFMALKEKFDGTEWQSWTLILMMRLPEVLDAYRQELADLIQYQYFLQYQFRRQWRALRRYANERGVKIIGDVPIYVPLDSADVWANPYIFQLDPSRRPKRVAGCPPDAFNSDGQFWGQPLYDWDYLKKSGYSWWIRRLRSAAQMYDVVRLDHFRSFESFWSIPAGEKNATNGQWVKGPGLDFIHFLHTVLPNLEFIAEDLGFVTPQVRQLQIDSGYPGMRVIQFAFDGLADNIYLPEHYPENSVAYTTTHDCVSMGQWFAQASPECVTRAREKLALNDQEGQIWGVIRACMASKSKLCIIQMQDYLELGAGSRMNNPGTLSLENWTWRASPGFTSDTLAGKIRSLTEKHGRLV